MFLTIRLLKNTNNRSLAFSTCSAIFISPSQEPHQDDYHYHHPVLQVRKLRPTELGWVVRITSLAGTEVTFQRQGLRPACGSPLKVESVLKPISVCCWQTYPRRGQRPPAAPPPCPLSPFGQKPLFLFLFFPLKTSVSHSELSQPGPRGPWRPGECPPGDQLPCLQPKQGSPACWGPDGAFAALLSEGGLGSGC